MTKLDARCSKTAVTVFQLQDWACNGQRLVMTTAYDAVTARWLIHCRNILVGDSDGNVCLGFDNTLPVSMAMMNHHLEAVMRTRPWRAGRGGHALPELPPQP